MAMAVRGLVVAPDACGSSCFVAALLTAVPFALIHMPLHFIGDFSPGSLISSPALLLIVCAVIRLLIGVFLCGTHGSILAATIIARRKLSRANSVALKASRRANPSGQQ